MSLSTAHNKGSIPSKDTKNRDLKGSIPSMLFFPLVKNIQQVLPYLISFSYTKKEKEYKETYFHIWICLLVA